MIDSARQLWRAFAFALDATWAFRLRSLFVTLAVALGIAALTIIVTSVDGAQKMAREIVTMFGPDAAFVLGGDIRSRAVGKRTLTLTWDDARRIEQSLPGAYLVVPMRAKMGIPAKHRSRNLEVPVLVGATEGYATVWNWPLESGRDISTEDVERASKVALIGFDASRALFGDESPIGKVVFLKDIPFQIIGRLTERSFSGHGGNINERMVAPLTTLTQRFNMDRKYFRAIRVKFHDAERMAEHAENLRALLRELHNLGPTDPDDFTIITPDEVLKFLSMLKGSFVVFLGVTAAVAMVVGGFVLANLFYISVSERTAEIGLRKAVGATNWAITAQFLFEAGLLTAGGAVLGMALGMGMGQLLAGLGLLEIEFSIKVFVLALCSALLIGLIFGIRPARRAASLDPVAALRRDAA